MVDLDGDVNEFLVHAQGLAEESCIHPRRRHQAHDISVLAASDAPDVQIGDPRIGSGPVDQAEVERRDDVLVYTSAPLSAPLRIAGPLRAQLAVSSSAKDTDFVARLVDVWPDGRAINIQEGALRARYRNGVGAPRVLTPGEIVVLDIDMRAIAWRLPAGHRLRLVIAGSSFPRLERNLHTGGGNADESVSIVASNRVHHGAAHPSYLELFVLDDADSVDALPR